MTKKHQNGSTSEKSSSVLPVLLFTLLYTSIAAIATMTGRNTEFLVYLAVMLCLIVLVWKVHNVVTLSQGALWGLSIWGCAHMAGGLLSLPEQWPLNTGPPVLYNLWLIPGWLKYDQLVHAYGFGITTWVCWQGLRNALERRGADITPTPGLLTLVAAAGMGFGALNEVIEFLATVMLDETNVGGYMNTSLDLVFNLIGAIVAAILIRFTEMKKGKSLPYPAELP